MAKILIGGVTILIETTDKEIKEPLAYGGGEMVDDLFELDGRVVLPDSSERIEVREVGGPLVNGLFYVDFGLQNYRLSIADIDSLGKALKRIVYEVGTILDEYNLYEDND